MTKIGGAYKDISELDVASAGAGANEVGVLQSAQEKRMTLTQLGTFMAANIGNVTPTSIVVSNGIVVSNTRLSFFGNAKTSQAAALTTGITSAVDGTYGSAENEVLSSNRFRIGELSNILTSYGLIA